MTTNDQVQAAVKPLEWFDSRFSERYIREAAHSILGDYTAGEYSDGGFYFTVPPLNEDRTADTFESAKAAAQSDYEQRILSALVAAAYRATPADPALDPATVFTLPEIPVPDDKSDEWQTGFGHGVTAAINAVCALASGEERK